MVSAAMGVVAAGWIIGKFTMAAAEDTSRCVSDVVERDLSCRTRISSFSESPGQPRSELKKYRFPSDILILNYKY